MSTEIFNKGESIYASRFGSGNRKCTCGDVPGVMLQITSDLESNDVIATDDGVGYVQMCFNCFAEMSNAVIEFGLSEGHLEASHFSNIHFWRRQLSTSKGYFIELLNRSTNRIVFSAATADLTKEAFMALWTTVGESIHGTQTRSENDRWSQFELRITPITG